MLTVLVSTISNSQVILLKKNVRSFCKCKSYSHFFFSKNISVYAILNDQKFNDTLTNDIVSFEQLALIIFLFLHENIYYGYSLESPRQCASNKCHLHMFAWRNKKIFLWLSLLSEDVKLSVRRTSVLQKPTIDWLQSPVINFFSYNLFNKSTKINQNSIKD